MKTIHVLACLMLFILGHSAHADIISSGYDASHYSQSSASFGGGSAAQAFNGGSWNAGAYGSQWIQVDLGADYYVDGFGFITSQLPAGVTFAGLYVSETAIGADWVNLAAAGSHTAFSMAGTHVDVEFKPAAGRFVEIVINNAGSWAALDHAYFTGIAVPRDVSVPEPASLALTGLAGALLLGARRRAL